MCLTMMDPVTNWFKLVELSVVEIPGKKQSELKVLTEYFDKNSWKIARLFNKSWFVGTLAVTKFFMSMAANLSCTSVN